MANLNDVAALAATNGHLAVVSTLRADGTIQASLVNAGISAHPVTGQQVAAFVGIGGGAKLANLRRRPSVALTFHQGWQWITVEGNAELVGPDDAGLGVQPDQLAALLRAIFTDAGGTHDNWPEYDDTMVRERRAAVLITPTRVYTNPAL